MVATKILMLWKEAAVHFPTLGLCSVDLVFVNKNNCTTVSTFLLLLFFSLLCVFYGKSETLFLELFFP